MAADVKTEDWLTLTVESARERTSMLATTDISDPDPARIRLDLCRVRITQTRDSAQVASIMRRTRASYHYAVKHVMKDVVTPYTHISEASRYILYTIILTFDGICTIS